MCASRFQQSMAHLAKRARADLRVDAVRVDAGHVVLLALAKPRTGRHLDLFRTIDSPRRLQPVLRSTRGILRVLGHALRPVRPTQALQSTQFS
eukprot:scaffold35478_cov129-Isochrysis_galbana.AAC.5